MSFANKLKQQLLNLRYDELRQLRARTHGLLRFSKAFWTAENAAADGK